MVNSESILFDDFDIESRMVEEISLTHDRHAMFNTGETMVVFVEMLCDSLTLISYCFVISRHQHELQLKFLMMIKTVQEFRA